MKHDMISSRIREAEHAQIVAELNQKISRLEVKVSQFIISYRIVYIQNVYNLLCLYFRMKKW